MKVYELIANVTADLAAQGISKTRVNKQQDYKFRGIDDVFNALAPLLARHRLSIIPRMLSRAVVERTTKIGSALFYVTVEAEFIFAADDGSNVIARTFGEAMDSGDKATNKAMSAAYKYAALMTFAIPTEAQDPDAETHEVTGEATKEEREMLQTLRDAAMRGKKGFENVWHQLPKSDLKRDVWMLHKGELTAAMNTADELGAGAQ